MHSFYTKPRDMNETLAQLRADAYQSSFGVRCQFVFHRGVFLRPYQLSPDDPMREAKSRPPHAMCNPGRCACSCMACQGAGQYPGHMVSQKPTKLGV